MKISPSARRWLGKSLGIAPRDLLFTPLRGANSSLVFRVESVQNPNKARFVLRIFHDEQWLREESDLASHEAAALMEAQATRVCAPEVIAWENGPDIMGAPFVLMTHLAGEVQLKPRDLNHWLAQFAEQLAILHQHRAPDFSWNYRSWLEVETLRVPLWTRNPHLWQRAIEIAQQKPPNEVPVFIHRDFHPVNVLFQNDTVSGVVDWVNACRGAASVDVAHCRTNLALLFGVSVADRFLECYEKRAGRLENQAYWDVISVLDMVLPAPEWYRPWSEFGVNELSATTMQERDEIYLESVLQRV